jgi:hypothetical protein
MWDERRQNLVESGGSGDCSRRPPTCSDVTVAPELSKQRSLQNSFDHARSVNVQHAHRERGRRHYLLDVSKRTEPYATRNTRRTPGSDSHWTHVGRIPLSPTPASPRRTRDVAPAVFCSVNDWARVANIPHAAAIAPEAREEKFCRNRDLCGGQARHGRETPRRDVPRRECGDSSRRSQKMHLLLDSAAGSGA